MQAAATPDAATPDPAAFRRTTPEPERLAYFATLRFTHERIRERPRYTQVRPWRPMSNAEWDAIRPYVERPLGPGRPLRDPRTRLDLMVLFTLDRCAWRNIPRTVVSGDTLGRNFRRWTHAGLWRNLMFALARTDCPPALKRMEYWIVRLARRGMRIMGTAGFAVARLLGLMSALPLPPWLLPDPDLSVRFKTLRMQAVMDPSYRYTLAIDRIFHRLIAFVGRKRPWTRLLEPA